MLMQDGKIERAKDQIIRAQTLIPESQAIQNLSHVIHGDSAQSESKAAQTSDAVSPLPAAPVTNNIREPNQP